MFEGSREDYFTDLMSWAEENNASCDGFMVTNFGTEGYGLRATRDIKVSSAHWRSLLFLTCKNINVSPVLKSLSNPLVQSRISLKFVLKVNGQWIAGLEAEQEATLSIIFEKQKYSYNRIKIQICQNQQSGETLEYPKIILSSVCVLILTLCVYFVVKPWVKVGMITEVLLGPLPRLLYRCGRLQLF